MATPQTTVATTPDIGVPGQIPTMDGVEDALVFSKTNKEASASMPFGIMVKQGTLDDDILLITAAANKLAGVTTWAHDFARTSELDTGGVKPGATVGVVWQGPVLVLPEDAVTPSSGVHVRINANGGNTQPGAFRGAADATHSIDCTGFARWLTSGSSTAPAVVFVDMTNAALAVAD